MPDVNDLEDRWPTEDPTPDVDDFEPNKARQCMGCNQITSPQPFYKCDECGIYVCGNCMYPYDTKHATPYKVCRFCRKK